MSSRQHKDGSGGWAADSRRHTPDARMHIAVSCARARVCAHSPHQILDKPVHTFAFRRPLELPVVQREHSRSVYCNPVMIHFAILADADRQDWCWRTIVVRSFVRFSDKKAANGVVRVHGSHFGCCLFPRHCTDSDPRCPPRLVFFGGPIWRGMRSEVNCRLCKDYWGSVWL